MDMKKLDNEIYVITNMILNPKIVDVYGNSVSPSIDMLLHLKRLKEDNK